MTNDKLNQLEKNIAELFEFFNHFNRRLNAFSDLLSKKNNVEAEEVWLPDTKRPLTYTFKPKYGELSQFGKSGATTKLSFNITDKNVLAFYDNYHCLVTVTLTKQDNVWGDDND